MFYIYFIYILFKRIFREFSNIELKTGISAGYGFIDYYDHHTAAIALQQFSGKTIYGLEMKINWAFANTRVTTEETAMLSKSNYFIFFFFN